MSTIITILGTDNPASSRTDINNNFASLNVDVILNTAKVSYPGPQVSIVGISGTKAQFNTELTDGTFMYIGDAPTTHTHTAAQVTDFDTEVDNNPAVVLNTAKVSYTDAAKVAGIEALADVTDATNVTAAGAEMTANKDAASGYAGLDALSKINPLQLPALAISETFVVATEVAQLALTVQEGDVAVRTDESKSYIALNDTNATMADWQELLTPADVVQSVYGRTGVVTAQSGDYTADQITETGTNKILTATARTKLTGS